MNRKIYYYLTLSLLFCSYFSNTALSFDNNKDLYSWTGGGAYPKITFSGKTQYLISDVSGVWKADLAANTWGKSNAGLDNLSLSNIEFSKSTPAIGYVATRQGIFKSNDSGGSWKLVSEIGTAFKSSRGNSYRNIAIYPDDPNSFIYFDDAGRLSDYSNSTVSQIPLELTSEYISSIMLVTGGQQLLVGTSQHRFLFKKDNSTWQLIEKVTLPTLDLVSVSFDTQVKLITVGAQSIFISSDNASTWEETNVVQLIGSQSNLSRVSGSYDMDGNLHLLAAWNSGWRSGVIASSDGGITWSKPVNKLNFSTDNPTRSWQNYSLNKILSVHMSENKPNQMYITTYWGVWRSTDFGKTWTENFMEGASNTVGSSIALTEDDDVITASMDVGIIKYPSGTATATSLLPNSPDYNIYKLSAGHFWNVISDGTRIIATNSPWDSSHNQIVISEDSGANWQIVDDGLPGNYSTDNTIWEKGYAKALIQDSNQPQRFLLGIDGHGLFTSLDGGYSWKASETSPPSVKIYNGLALNPVNNTIYWGTVDNGIYLSTDNGKTWQQDGLHNASIFDISASPDGNIFAGVAGSLTNGAALYIKENNATDWRLLKQFPSKGAIDAITLDPKNNDVIVIGINSWNYQNTGCIYISKDAGKSWRLIEGEFGIGVADMVISKHSNTLSATGYSQGVFSIDLTPYLME